MWYSFFAILRHAASCSTVGVAKDALGFSSPSCAYYHADQCHTYHNPGSTPTRAAMVIQYTAKKRQKIKPERPLPRSGFIKKKEKNRASPIFALKR